MKTAYWILLSGVIAAVAYLVGVEDGWLHRVNYEAVQCVDHWSMCP